MIKRLSCRLLLCQGSVDRIIFLFVAPQGHTIGSLQLDQVSAVPAVGSVKFRDGFPDLLDVYRAIKILRVLVSQHHRVVILLRLHAVE